ncbi:hypothetical protein ES705_28270 [subsurface metagenome]
MSKKDIEKKHHTTFEKIKQNGADGQEYWMARQLSKILDYAEFRNFLPVIKKAKKACANSDQKIDNHFVEIDEMVPIGSGAKRKMQSYALSRYACYLIVQNADPLKPVIANGQTYFAIFQNHGYKGLYGALDAKAIHRRKGLKKSQQILDNMNSTELAANLFRATQTEEKLRRENIKGKTKANKTHFEVGQKVRKTIDELGGTMPEDLPTPEEDLKKLKRRVKSSEIKMLEGNRE